MFRSWQSRVPSSRGFVVTCQKKFPRDLKKKPKKKEVSKQEEDVAPKPPRITDTGPRSLKSQLRFVKSFQGNDKREDKPVVRQKYSKPREKKPAPLTGAEAIRPKRILRPELNPSRQERARQQQEPRTEEEIAAEAAKKKATERARKVAGLYHKKHVKGPQAALIVDGYNVMLKWIEEPGQCHLRQTLGSNFDLIRSTFLREISAYSSKSLRVTVAFDAIGNLSAPPLAREALGGIEVAWVAFAEADVFIAQEALNLRKDGCPYVLVASNDHDVSEACWTDEVFPMSCMQLLQEIRKEKKAYQRQQAEKALQAGGQDLGSRMMASSPQLYHKLERMRRGQQRR